MELLEQITKDLKQRLDELRPQIEEIPRLEQALRALDERGGAGAAAANRPTRRTSRRASGARRIRVSGDARRAQFLAIVRAEPEARVRDIAAQMQTTPNNVYGLVRRLEADGVLKRADGRFAVTG